MENQGKRLLLAVGLALLVILGWNMIFPQDKPEPPKPAPGSGSAAAIVETPPIPGVAPAPTAPTGPTGPTGPAAVAPSKPEAPRAPEEQIELPFPGRLTATFSSYGGALTSWKLADSRFERDATHGELLSGASESPDACRTPPPSFIRGEQSSEEIRTKFLSSSRNDLTLDH